MKITHDAEADAMAIIFREAEVVTKELGEGIAVEYDQDGRLAGIEVLDVVRRFGDDQTFRQITFENLTAPFKV